MTHKNQIDTFTGNAGLQIEEPLLFEKGHYDTTGVDLPEINFETVATLGKFARKEVPKLPGLSEPEAVRHYTRLSQKNYGIDMGFFPLGSCTMKHNPRLNEKVARLPGMAGVHPLQPKSTAQGMLELMWLLSDWLKELTGMPGVALSPAAGAQGELCGILAIKAALAAKNELDTRTTVLVPDSAHGTNPATAAACGFQVKSIPSGPNGLIDFAALEAAVNSTTAALMLTNPSTCGLFERDTIKIGELLHKHGAYYYCDGANFNALLGQVKPGDLGVDVMHINLHKTFSTPHGGGGPGSGPVVFSERLAPFAPVPYVTKKDDGSFDFVRECPSSMGRLKAFHGQVGMFIRALSYMLSHGIDGLTQVSADAVLSARYLVHHLKDVLNVPFPEPCMHEVLFDDKTLRKHGLETIDLAKILQDEGFHPMTTYFPLVVRGSMLVEPTETESKVNIDQFIGAVKHWMKKAETKEGQARIKAAPIYTPRRRFDEATAARHPRLTHQS